MSEAIIWIVILLFLFGGGIGGAIFELLDNHKKRAALKRELNAAHKDNERLQQQLDKALNTTPGGPDVAAMIQQARLAIDERAVLIDALTRVQATDSVVPQLPQAVRDFVDEALDNHRARISSGSLALTSSKKPKTRDRQQ
ncbi:hypothetical protein [Nocardia carnea]|uniref:hypothetical protein n=1 Tax=Nocardia carnea TaxID=37328 RepID=UPI0024566A09|nr:hypothetical protein [Nocardia carnea]